MVEATITSSEIKTYDCPNCCLCNSPGDFLYQGLRDRLFNAPGEWNLRQCSNTECGLVWLDPMPMPEEIGKAYTTYYTHEAEPTERGFLWYGLRAVYRTIKLASSYALGIRQQEIQLEHMYLDQVKPGKLLEIGYGSGKFLHQMQELGWQVEGVDFDAKAAEAMWKKYGIKAHVGSVEGVGYADHMFDAITMNHVIEHVPNPVEVFQECYRILKPGGYLVVSTPNINSWGHRKFQQDWRGLEPPRHLHLFSPHTLEECSKKARFEQINTQTTSIRSACIFSVSLDIQKLRSHDMDSPNKLNFFKATLLQYYYLLFKKQENCGEEAILVAQKISSENQ
jgi:2-polyprenyl-3-methyl-5-hydroxy-6-metoxy-1,4-benzoquinol methylase